MLTLLFSQQLQAKFLYKDEVIQNPNFQDQIETIGAELKEKTGVSLYLSVKKELDENVSISDYEKSISSSLNEPFILLAFSEVDKKVDIFARPESLYEDFNKKQVLSTNSTFVGAVMTAIIFARSFDDIKEVLTTSSGTILPILGERAKGKDIINKYSVALFNGYSDIAEQVADSRGKSLSTSAGNGNKYTINAIRIIFYGIILFAVFKYIRGKIFYRKKKDDNEEG